MVLPERWVEQEACQVDIERGGWLWAGGEVKTPGAGEGTDKHLFSLGVNV